MASLAGKNGKEYEVILSDGAEEKTIKIQSSDSTVWVELRCNNCYLYDELIEQQKYIAYIFDNKRRIIDKIIYERSGAEYCYLDVTEEYPGKELIIKSSKTGTVIWAMDDGIVVPLEASGDWLKDINIGEIFFCYISKDYDEEYAAYSEKNLIEQAEQNFTVDETMIITTPVSGYAGMYYKQYGGIFIQSVTEDEIILTNTEESGYTISGSLTRQRDDFPEGTAVYAGAVTAKGRNGHTGSYTGMESVVLKPDGDIYVKTISGDSIYQDGTHSKEKGKF